MAPVPELAERAGQKGLVGEHVRIEQPGGGNARLKVPALVAGVIAGADSIDDMGLSRHGAMNRLFTGVRAPSTLGTFPRTFTFGHVRQLDAVASKLLINLRTSALLLPGAHQLTYVDIDDDVKPTFGYAKQGAGRGYTGVKGLNVRRGREPAHVRAGLRDDDLRDLDADAGDVLSNSSWCCHGSQATSMTWSSSARDCSTECSRCRIERASNAWCASK